MSTALVNTAESRKISNSYLTTFRIFQNTVFDYCLLTQAAILKGYWSCDVDPDCPPLISARAAYVFQQFCVDPDIAKATQNEHKLAISLESIGIQKESFLAVDEAFIAVKIPLMPIGREIGIRIPESWFCFTRSDDPTLFVLHGEWQKVMRDTSSCSSLKMLPVVFVDYEGIFTWLDVLYYIAESAVMLIKDCFPFEFILPTVTDTRLTIPGFKSINLMWHKCQNKTKQDLPSIDEVYRTHFEIRENQYAFVTCFLVSCSKS